MTVLRREPDNISNHFDALFRGLAPHGASFTNIDGLCHHGRTARFLFMEFKHHGERLNGAVKWAFTDLAKLPRVTVWVLWKPPAEGGLYQVAEGPDFVNRAMSSTQLQACYAAWWKGSTL